VFYIAVVGVWHVRYCRVVLGTCSCSCTGGIVVGAVVTV
jgi:hypothetical protein